MQAQERRNSSKVRLCLALLGLFGLLCCSGLDAGSGPGDTDRAATQTLALTAVTPARWLSTGAIPLELNGSGFVPGTQVWVGEAPSREVEVLSGSRLRARLPAGAAVGPAAVVVQRPDGAQARRDDLFTYSATTLGFDSQDPAAFVRGATADFDHDGNQDIALPFFYPEVVAVLRGDGRGGLQLASRLFFDEAITQIERGDFNGDGWQDLLVASSKKAVVQLFFGAAAAGFTPGPRLSARHSQLLVADLDGNGRPDLVTLQPGALSWFRNNGQADVFDAPISTASPVSNVSFWAAQAGDINKDGRDEIVASLDNSIIYVYNFTSAWSQYKATTPPIGFLVPYDLIDYNLDGNIDILTSRNVVLGTGAGGFSTAAIPHCQNTSIGPNGEKQLLLTAADWNQNGQIDLLGAHWDRMDYCRDGSQDAGVILPSPPWAKPYANVPLYGGHPFAFVFADLQGSPQPELVMIRGQHIVLVSSSASGPVVSDLSDVVIDRPVASTAGDLNGDGYDDVVLANSGQPSLALLLSVGRKRYDLPRRLDSGSLVSDLRIVDQDRDGHADLVFASAAGDRIEIWRGDGRGGLSPAQTLRPDLGPERLAVADFSGDGWPDLITVSPRARSLSFLVSNGGPGFLPPQIRPLSAQPGGLALGDLDRDGKLDLAVTYPAERAIGLFRRVSVSSSLVEERRETAMNAVGIAIADINSDGEIDLWTTDKEPLSSFGDVDYDGSLDSPAQLVLRTPPTPVSWAFPRLVRTNGNADIIANLNNDQLPDLVFLGDYVVRFMFNTSW